MEKGKTRSIANNYKKLAHWNLPIESYERWLLRLFYLSWIVTKYFSRIPESDNLCYLKNENREETEKQKCKYQIKRVIKIFVPCLNAERISFRHRSIISAPTTKAPYWGRPGLVIIVIALEEIILEEMLLSNIKIPRK